MNNENWTESGMFVNLRYQNGDSYIGEVKRGQRDGVGTFKSATYIHGVAGENPTAEQLTHWTEYSGKWQSDKPNGLGTMKLMRADGKTIWECEGDWVNGQLSRTTVIQN